MLDVRAQPLIGTVLDAAAEHLARAGLAEPRREATALWAGLAGVAAGAVWLRRHAPADDAMAARFWQAVARRAGGVPRAYATGRAGFRHLDLALDPRALIPRPETEGLVDLVLDWCREQRATGNGKRGAWGRAADIGTGCGCLALALATEGKFERVIAVDRAPEAAALAAENVARVAPGVPVEVRIGDVLAPLAGERVRVIVSNPPYLSVAEYAELDPAVRDFEPRDALVGGEDGLDVTRALLAGAGALLEPGGLLALEIDERRGAVVRALARRYGWARATIHDDVFGRPRYALVTDPRGEDR